MIGVAMYELVWSSFEMNGIRLTLSRFESATITLSAKSFESKRIEPQFKFTRRQV